MLRDGTLPSWLLALLALPLLGACQGEPRAAAATLAGTAEQKALVTASLPQAHANAAPSPSPSARPAAFTPNPVPGRVGHEGTLGDTRFVVWGAAETGSMPKGLATSLDSRWLFCSNMGVADERTLSVYRSDPLHLEKHLDIPGKNIELAVSADGADLFVTNSRAWGRLLVFDTNDRTLERDLPLPGFPKWMLVPPDGKTLYASLWALDGISRVTLADGSVQTLQTPKGRYSRHERRDKNPRGMALSRDGKTLIVANNADETLSLVDIATWTERKRVRVGYAPRHVVAAHDGRLFVSLTGNDSVLELDPVTFEPKREIAVGKRPKTIALSHDDRFLYAANFVSNSLSVVDLETHARLDIELDVYKPSGLAVRADDRFVYVTGFCTDDVWAIERLDPGEQPTLPLGPDRFNEPCFDCPSSFVGCPYFPGPDKIVE
jgi:DNA-binding beta-propeller fold protein YncE